MSKHARRIGSRVSSGIQSLKGSEKVILAIGGVAVAGIAVYAFFNPGPRGGLCSTPGTPCYTCAYPHVTQFNAASAQYTAYRAQFLAADSKAGTGFTAQQLSILNTLQTSMDVSAKGIADCAKTYVPSDPIAAVRDTLFYGVLLGVGVLAAGAAVANIIKALRTPTITGSGAANIIDNAVTRVAAETGEITVSSATAFASEAIPETTADIALDTTLINNYVADAVIPQLIADTLIIDDTIAMEADLADTLAVLALV